MDGIQYSAIKQIREVADLMIARDSKFGSKDLRAFSLARQVALLGDEKFYRTGSLERDIHEEIARHNGPPPNGGVWVPAEALGLALGNRAAYQVGTAAQGGNLVQTTFAAGVIDLLRNRSVVMSLGAQLIDGLRGNVSLPVWAGTVTPGWVAESVAVAESEGTIQTITSSPKTIGARSVFSRLMALQATPSIDLMIAEDLTKALGVALDLVALTGTGSGGQPTGVLNAGITSASGAAATYATILGVEAGVLNANGVTQSETSGWATTPNVATLLAQRAKGTLNWGIWSDAGSLRNGSIGGYRAVSTLQMPAGGLVFGDWSQLLVMEWGPGIEILVNPVHAFNTGDLSVRAMLSADIVVRHAASFSQLTSVT